LARDDFTGRWPNVRGLKPSRHSRVEDRPVPAFRRGRNNALLLGGSAVVVDDWRISASPPEPGPGGVGVPAARRTGPFSPGEARRHRCHRVADRGLGEIGHEPSRFGGCRRRRTAASDRGNKGPISFLFAAKSQRPRSMTMRWRIGSPHPRNTVQLAKRQRSGLFGRCSGQGPNSATPLSVTSRTQG